MLGFSGSVHPKQGGPIKSEGVTLETNTTLSCLTQSLDQEVSTLRNMATLSSSSLINNLLHWCDISHFHILYPNLSHEWSV